MKKLSVFEANNLLNKLKLDNIFEAYVRKNESKSIKKLNTFKQMYTATKIAETVAGIDKLKTERDTLVEFDKKYYNIKNKPLYYKENIPDTLIDIVTEKNKEIDKYIKELNDLIDEKSKDVYIEI